MHDLRLNLIKGRIMAVSAAYNYVPQFDIGLHKRIKNSICRVFFYLFIVNVFFLTGVINYFLLSINSHLKGEV